LLLLLAIAGVVLYRRRRDLFFWYALFFVGLIPVSQIVPIVTLMNDRYLYFPMLGASAILGFALMRDVEWAEIQASRKHWLSAAFSLLVIGGCAVATDQRIEVWRNSYTLWDDTLRKSPNVALAHDAFGEALLERGAIDDAIRQFQVALRLEPEIPSTDKNPVTRNAVANTYNNLGAAYGIKGMTDVAIAQFTTAIRLNPGLDKAYFNMGNALMHKGAVVQALQSFETACRLNPSNPAYDANLRMTREILNAGNFRNP
jgi:tetratricopeptide (TPR) repeat protein